MSRRLKVGDYVREVNGEAIGVVVHIMRGVVVVNWPPKPTRHCFSPRGFGEGCPERRLSGLSVDLAGPGQEAR
jgi:hypothetical protein